MTNKTSELTQEASVALMRWLSQTTKRLGVAQHIYVVGGAVRNFLISEPIKDIDMVVDSLALGKGRDSAWVAQQIARWIPTRTEIVTDALMVSKVFIKGPWLLDGHEMEGEVIEIVNAREEVYEEGQGHKPLRVDPTTLERDVQRREFTFNTLMWRLLDLADGPDRAEIIDLTGCGVKDLNDRVMRCPQDPNKTFFEDPTRIIRTIKFAFKYGFTLPPDVRAAAIKQAPQLKRIPSKTWSVLQTVILENPQYKKALDVMLDLGVVDVIAEMVQEDAAFATTLTNYAEKRGVAYLFDLMDIGIPLKSLVSYFTAQEQARIREVTSQMPREEALDYVAKLRNPGAAYADKSFVPSLARTLGIPSKGMADFMPSVTAVGRELLLKFPELASDPASLRDLVRDQVLRASARQANTQIGAAMSFSPSDLQILKRAFPEFSLEATSSPKQAEGSGRLMRFLRNYPEILEADYLSKNQIRIEWDPTRFKFENMRATVREVAQLFGLDSTDLKVVSPGAGVFSFGMWGGSPSASRVAMAFLRERA
jgi:tRNA nucleotidyltransferase/poly(A) polymerase